MSKICQITGKKAMVGNNVSHSKRRTKRAFNVNLFEKKFFWVEQQAWIRLTHSSVKTELVDSAKTSSWNSKTNPRTINKLGLNAAMMQAAEKGYLTGKDIKFLEF